MSEHPQPSRADREFVAGAYDLHVHVAPDVVPRLIDDVTLAQRCAEVGLGGFVLKSHYVQTAERAAVVRAAVPGVDVLGALALNVATGGMNPVAIEIAARSGARVVWFPTVDSVNQRTSKEKAPPGSKPPMWAALQADLRAQGIDPAPVRVVDESLNVLDDVRAVLDLMAKHDLVLATGHLGAAEILAVVRAASEAGVRRNIVTHPEFTSQRLTVEQQHELAELGALLERCFTTPYTGKVKWEQMVANIRAVGPQHSFLSSDLGQPTNPPVEDGLPLMARDLLDAGFSESEVRRMAVENTRWLAAAPRSAEEGAA